LQSHRLVARALAVAVGNANGGAVALHYNGASWRGAGWTSAPAPAARGTGTPLAGMAAVGPGTVRAVGSVWDGTNGTGKPLVIRTTNG
jgi:hypothetical protein